MKNKTEKIGLEGQGLRMEWSQGLSMEWRNGREREREGDRVI